MRRLIRPRLFPRFLRWVDDRAGGTPIVRKALDKVFPGHWSFLLGEIALYSFVVLVITGVFLTFFFVPDVNAPVIYHGVYAPLEGVRMSQAYESTLRISFEVRAGMVMRQTHHWAAVVFIGAIVIHLLRVFFTGAFRRPRELNWIVGVTMLILAIVNGFAGYSLPDDLLSGTGLRIAYSIAISIPVVGTWLASLGFGGPFPSPEVIPRLFAIHVLFVPVALAVLITIHLALMVRQKHTQYPGPGRTEENVVGHRLWPHFALKTLGMLFLTAGVLTGLGGLAQINPVWLYGPYDPFMVSAPAQPDWYMGWLEGALRLMPAWEIRAFGFEIPNVFFPGVLLPGIVFTTMLAWPFIEARATGDHAEHHLLDRPTDRAFRLAVGVAATTFFLVLFVAGGNDIVATSLDLSVNAVTRVLRVLLFVLPVVTGFVAHRIAGDRSPSGIHPDIHELKLPAESETADVAGTPVD